MPSPENWYCGLAPHTEIEIRQAELDVLYARQDGAERRARFEEAPSRRMCGVIGCENPADASGVFCSECWKTIGPYDRPVTEELCDE